MHKTYELSGNVQGLVQDFASKRVTLSLSVNEEYIAKMLYDDLHEAEKLSIKISKYREKRSLDANAYFFVLCDKLATKLNTSKESVYRNAIKDIGGNSTIVCVKDIAVEKLCENWCKNGLGWQADTIPSKIDGCTNVILYYGSSTYDTAQMSRLISNIVEECHAQGINTRTPDEIAELLALWDEKPWLKKG